MRRMNSSNIEQGELVVAGIMFAEQAGKKRRLALVISNNSFNKSSKGIVVLKATSSGRSTPYSIRLTNNHTDRKALKKESDIMAGFPVTLAKENIRARPDRISNEKLEEVKGKIKELYEL